LNTVRFLTAVLTLAASTAVLDPAAAQDNAANRERNTLIVRGQGEVSARPDVAYTTVGVITEGKRAQDASQANAAGTQRVMEALRKQGIAEKDIQTSNYSVQPRYENRPNREPVIVGYQVSNQVRATVRDLTKVGPVIDAALEAGANNIYGVSFGLQDRARFTADALTEAVQEARRKADTLARAAGVRILGIAQIQEGTTARLPIVQEQMEFAARAAATPISPGELTVNAAVTITFNIAQNGGR
jgi:uncharacterized protein